MHKHILCLCFTSLQQRGHLETEPPFTVPCKRCEARQIHRSHGESNPRPSHGTQAPHILCSLAKYTCRHLYLCSTLFMQNMTLVQFLFSDHPMSVVGGVNFFSFSTSFRCTDLLQILCRCSLVGPRLSLFKFFMELGNFGSILKKSIKPLIRNHSYLDWRVPRKA